MGLLEVFLTAYFEQDVLESLLKVDFPLNYRVKGHRKGTHKSSVSGQNIDFKEHREYVQGDDISKIDWKLYGRTEKFYIKEQEEEASCNVYVIIDKSASMNYTSGNKNKLEYAKYLFAAIYTVFTRQGDGVGLGLFDTDFKEVVPVSRSGLNISRINVMLNEIDATGKTGLQDLPVSIKKSSKKDINIIYLLSDFIVNFENITYFIKDINKFANEIFLLHLTDPLEIDFNFKGEYLFKDYESNKELILDASEISHYYNDFFNKHIEKIYNISNKYGCYYFRLDTKLPYTENFMKFVSFYRNK
jgi:uncharacterized protein (DUF58 family)